MKKSVPITALFVAVLHISVSVEVISNYSRVEKSQRVTATESLQG